MKIRIEEVVEVYIFPMQDLKRWFQANFNYYPQIRESSTVVGDGKYNTLNKVIPFAEKRFRDFITIHGYYHTKVSTGV